MTWLLAPDCSATAVREPLVDTAKPWNRPAATFAAPMPIISWFGIDLVAAAGGEARRGGDGVGERHERDADRGDEQRADIVETSVHGSDGRGRPSGSAPTVADVEARTARRDDRGPDDGDEHGRDLRRDAGQHEQHGEGAEADARARSSSARRSR